MGLFRRKSSTDDLRPCPQCSQLLSRDALECPMCGLDLRELHAFPGPSDDAA